MRKFIVGDLHGSIDLFNQLLLEIGFDFEEDTIYSVGDLIDRGTDSMACLRLLKEPWFKAVMGNHEEFLINTILKNHPDYWWVRNGGSWYRKEDQKELKELAVLAEQLPYAITIGNIGICHAQAPTLDWNDSKTPDSYNRETMLWSRNTYDRNDKRIVQNINKIYVGHTIVSDVETIGNTTFIDTGAYYTGVLTCVEI